MRWILFQKYLFLSNCINGNKSDWLRCQCLHFRHLKLSEMNHTPALLSYSDFFGFSKTCFFLLSIVNMKECLLLCFCLWNFFGSISITSSLNPTSVSPLMFTILILAKCYGITSDFFCIFFFCIYSVYYLLTYQKYCLWIFVSKYFPVLWLFLCCFVWNVAHMQLLALFDLGSFNSRVNKCSRAIFILKYKCLLMGRAVLL